MGDVGVHIQLVAVLEPLLDDVQVQFAHAGDHQFMSLGVAAVGEGRVLVGDLGQADGDLGLILASLGLDRAGHHRRWEADRVNRKAGIVVLPPTLETVSETCRSSNLAMATMSPAMASVDLLLLLALHHVDVTGLGSSCRCEGSPASCRA